MRQLAALPALLVLAACPKGSDSASKPTEPPVRRDDAQPSRLLSDDTAGVVLPPAPALPPPPASLPPPPTNPRVTPEAVAFGELLFHDPRLSADGTRACATCHDPARGYAGGVDPSASGKLNARRTPTLVNLAWVPELGWDGRTARLADHLPAHMGGQLDLLAASTARIAAIPTYGAHIARVGGAPADAIVQALEAFVLTRYEGDAPWDALERTARATPGTTPTDPVVAGYLLFRGKGQCAACHSPPLYTDNQYHRVERETRGDPGRGLVDPAQTGAFRTPTLRGATRRGSYFHAGTKPTLAAVVAHYAELGASGGAGLDPVVATIRLTSDEAEQLAAFLGALTASRPAPAKPLLP